MKKENEMKLNKLVFVGYRNILNNKYKVSIYFKFDILNILIISKYFHFFKFNI